METLRLELGEVDRARLDGDETVRLRTTLCTIRQPAVAPTRIVVSEAGRKPAGCQVFLFSAPQAKELFDKSPEQFRVAYHGYCATGVAMGKKIPSNPELFTVREGVTYLFSSTEAKAMFDKDPSGTIAKADRNWPALN